MTIAVTTVLIMTIANSTVPAMTIANSTVPAMTIANSTVPAMTIANSTVPAMTIAVTTVNTITVAIVCKFPLSRGEYKLECHEAMSVFRLCSEQDRPRAIRLCAPIMARAKTLSCLLAKRLETSPMGMFSTCLRYACTNTDLSCRHLKLYLQGCPTTMALRRLECGSG
nr:hypothetical protein BaRGS_023460 [Batillaria attramentaria]